MTNSTQIIESGVYSGQVATHRYWYVYRRLYVARIFKTCSTPGSTNTSKLMVCLVFFHFVVSELTWECQCEVSSNDIECPLPAEIALLEFFLIYGSGSATWRQRRNHSQNRLYKNKALLSQLQITGITQRCVLECPFVVDLNRAEKLGAC